MNDNIGPSPANLLGMAKTAALAGNSEEALGYFNRVLELDPECSEAWIGKGKAAGWQSSLAHLRIAEALVAFNHAIATTPEANRGAVTTEAVDEVNRLVAALYGMARKHLLEYVSLDGSWPTYLDQVSQMLDALEQVHKWAPNDRTTLDNIVHLCKDNIEGVAYRDQFNNNAPGLLSLNPSYEALLKGKRDSAIAAIKDLDPTYAPPAIEKKQAEACFVVTATMGDYDHPKVRLMRRFRDEWLRTRPFGTEVVGAYYAVGPVVARAIKRSSILRWLSYQAIVRPAAKIAAALLRAE